MGSAFVRVALFFVAFDFGFVILNASGAYPGIPAPSIGTRVGFSAAGAILAAGVGIFLGLSAELLAGMSLLGAMIGAVIHAPGQMVQLLLPTGGSVAWWLGAALDTMLMSVYVVLIVQVVTRQSAIE